MTDEKDLLAQISPALLESSTPDSSFPTSTRVLQLTKRVANGLLSKFYDDGLEESSDWQQDDDDAEMDDADDERRQATKTKSRFLPDGETVASAKRAEHVDDGDSNGGTQT